MRRMYSKPQLLEAVEEESKLKGIKVFEDIKDKDGHLRFIEGELTIIEGGAPAVTYAKWSLSGAHLMLVLSGNIANATVIDSSNNHFASVTLPNWIFDKIKVLSGTSSAIRLDYKLHDTISNSQTATAVLSKSGSELRILSSSITLTADRAFRIQFDLLIDNE